MLVHMTRNTVTVLIFMIIRELNISTIKIMEWYRGEVLDGDWIVSKSMLGFKAEYVLLLLLPIIVMGFNEASMFFLTLSISIG